MLHNSCLFRIDDELTVLTAIISEKLCVIDAVFSISSPLTHAPADVFRNASAFFLTEAAHERNKEFSLRIKCKDGFLLEQNTDAQLLQFSDCVQGIDGVPGKAGDGFGQDHLDLTGPAISKHSVEFRSLFAGRTADPVVGVNTREVPVRIFSD